MITPCVLASLRLCVENLPPWPVVLAFAAAIYFLNLNPNQNEET